MVSSAIMIFLEGLQANNTREWFNENKTSYLHALKCYEEVVEKIISSVEIFDDEVVGLKAKDTIFRIYRDVRFSHDKSPYKNHFGAFVAPGGRKGDAGYYIHLEPGASMLAGGSWHPDAENLKKIRKAVDLFQEEFLEIVSEKAFKEWFGSVSTDDTLTQVPAGFNANSPVANYLKMKSFTVGHGFSNKEVLAPDFEAKLGAGCKAMFRFNKFLREAIEEK